MTITVTNIVAGPFNTAITGTDLPFAFKAFTEDEVEVYRLVAGVEVPVSDSLYDVTLNENLDGSRAEGGSVELTGITGDAFYVRAMPDLPQAQVWARQGSRLENLNEGLDRATLRLLRARYDLSNAIATAGEVLGLAGKVDKASLLSSVGGYLVGWITPLVNGSARFVSDKLADFNSVLDFGAMSTASANKATRAASAESPALFGAVEMPNGAHTVGAGNTSIFVRKGQNLRGKGFGATFLDATGGIANTVPTIDLGKNIAGTVDASGEGVSVEGFTILGGPGAQGAVRTNGVAGWRVSDVFFTATGIGVALGGGDGLLHDCMFDLGLNHIAAATAGNCLISDCLYYLGNYQITIGGDCRDLTFSNGQHEYFQYAGVFFADGAVDINNIRVTGSNFIQNEQFATTEGAVYVRSNFASFTIEGCTFRNIKGPAINYGSGVLNRMEVTSCLFDGLKTQAGYAQSTTMGGISAGNISSVIRDCTFRNLPGQPITLGGGEATTWVIQACDFSGNTGGTTEINITNTNPASRVYIIGCKGDGVRPLVNRQTTIPVIFLDNFETYGQRTITGAAALEIPNGEKAFVVTGSTAITSIVTNPGDAGREIIMMFSEARTITHSATLRLDGGANFVTTIYDTLSLMCVDGTYWVETGRRVNG